jgi:hypothetical protein
MTSIYRINLDKKWKLEDLYEFPHAYYQVYAFYYCFSPDESLLNIEHFNKKLENYKHDNQYRYINVYNRLQHYVPQQRRPIVSSIKYASPGWLDLILNPDLAFQIAKSVGIYLGLSITAAKTYSTIYKILGDINKERNKQKLDNYKLTKLQTEQLISMSKGFAELIGFENVGAIDAVTQNPEVTLKILLAQYRRLEKIGKYIQTGKISLTKKDSIDR